MCRPDGEPIKKLSFTAGRYPGQRRPITAADCDQVTKMIAAVEFRLDPTVQCAWKPLLDKGPAPALCGDGFTSRVVFSDNFDDGLSAWTDGSRRSRSRGASTSRGAPPPSTRARTTWAAWPTVPAPDEGDCAADGHLQQRLDHQPGGPRARRQALRLSFDHYVSTEAGYDGGNVKLSINGGAFATIPAAAYVFNAPNTTITVTGTNTNPLAGQPGFTGTDPGRATGSWGKSQVNLEAAGAKAGDTIEIQLRHRSRRLWRRRRLVRRQRRGDGL